MIAAFLQFTDEDGVRRLVATSTITEILPAKDPTKTLIRRGRMPSLTATEPYENIVKCLDESGS